MNQLTMLSVDSERQDRFLAARKYMGLSQDEFGRLLGLKRTAVFHREKGDVRVTAREIDTIARIIKRVCGVKLEDIPSYEPFVRPVNHNSVFKDPSSSDLLNFREEMGLSQKALAEKLGLAITDSSIQKYISDIELDRPSPRPVVMKVYKAYSQYYKKNRPVSQEQPVEPPKPPKPPKEEPVANKAKPVAKAVMVDLLYDRFDLQDPDDRAFLLIRIEHLERKERDEG